MNGTLVLAAVAAILAVILMILASLPVAKKNKAVARAQAVPVKSRVNPIDPVATKTSAPANFPRFQYGMPGFQYTVAPAKPTFELVPGAAWPSLNGRSRDTVVSWLVVAFPRLVVRAVPAGGPAVTYETRSDRITLVYDSQTLRVSDARIG